MNTYWRKFILLPVLMNLVFSGTLFSQGLSHRLDNTEKQEMPSYLRQIRQYHTSGITQPPAFSARASAEWEEIDHLIVTWTSYTTIIREIVRIAQTETHVIIVCSDSVAVKNNLSSNSVPLTNISYVIAPFNSIWCRDYGPWNIYSNAVDSLSLIDWIYNRPRPKDDTVPAAIERYTGLPMYEMTSFPNDLIHTGGNFMCDGMGTGFSSRLITDENPTKTEAEIDSIMYRYMGINRYILMSTLPYDGIHHIDMHMKLLDEETLLFGEYPQGVADGPAIENNMQYVLNNFNSPFGTPYKIVRIPMPPDAFGDYPDNGGDYRTYANAVFVNKTVILPYYEEQYDTIAKRIWQEALPGYRIEGIDCNSIIPSLGAIHCITKEVASSEPLWIVHQSLRDTYSTSGGYTVNATIMHRSGIAGASVYFRTDTTQPYQSVPMQLQSPPSHQWEATLPAQAGGTTVYYYIGAVSNSGKHQVRPLPAPAGYWHFSILLNTGFVTGIPEVSVANPFPNPASTEFNLHLKPDVPVQTDICITPVTGGEAKTLFSGMLYGERYFQFALDPFCSGTYILTVKSGSQLIRKKLLVVRSEK
ncbi:MAG: agmatine deiminase family protein [Bacteroidia bacterium]|nr:agmatine deiminase family protein [Bacteroidia bacterium]